MCVCVNLETYDEEIPWKDESDGMGSSPGSCNPWQCSSIRESIGDEIMTEVSLIAVKPLATVIKKIV